MLVFSGSRTREALDSQLRAVLGPLEEYRLPYRKTPASRDGAVDPSLVVPHPDNRLQHLRGLACRVRIEVHHRAALVAIDDTYGGGFRSFAERENTSHPLVLLEGD